MSNECKVHCWHVTEAPRVGGKESVSCCGCKSSVTRKPLFNPPNPPKK
jgi:hypothetical protein